MKQAIKYLTTIILLFALSCNESSIKDQVDNGFTSYINSYTSGVISCNNTIRITFNEELKDYKESDLGKDAPHNLIEISPKVKGKTMWVDSRTIEFVPDKFLKSNTVYNITVNIKKVLDVPKEYQIMEYQLRTIKQSFSSSVPIIKSYENDNIKLRYLTCEINTADYGNLEDIESIAKAELNGRTLPIKWQHSGTIHTLRIDSIERKEETQNIDIYWNGSNIDCDKKKTESVKLLSINDFEITNIETIHNPKCLVIHFSDPLLKTQNLKGLVTINKSDELSYSINNDELRIYPNSLLSGMNEIYISNGISNVLNKKLKNSIVQQISFEETKPAVRLVGKGTIMPSSTELIFPFEAVNLSAVDVKIIEIYANNIHHFFQSNNYEGTSDLKLAGRLIEKKQIHLKTSSFLKLKSWNMYHINLAKLIQINPGSIYRVIIQFKPEYSLYECNKLPIKTDELDAEKINHQIELENEITKWNKPSWYGEYYVPENYKWEERDNPNHISYYNDRNFIAKNIFASNLAVIAKGGDSNSMVFAISNIRTATPESDVTINIYNLQKQLMGTVKSDNNGFAKIDLKYQPFLLVAKKDNQSAYLKLDDGSSLSLSNFNVSGNVIQKGIKGYIYGERGVWRPGDKIYISFILENELSETPKDYPVIFEFINPKGQTVSRQVNNRGLNGFYCFVNQTDSESITGNWMAKIQVGGQTFSKRIKIETIKPNRLKVDLNSSKSIFAIQDNTAKITINSAWLHGGIANELKTDVKVSFSEKETTFKGLESFSFDDHSKELQSDEKLIFSGNLDSSGNTSFNFDLPVINSAKGMLNAHFTTRVFEQTGDFSINTKTIQYAPYKSFIGLKMPKLDSNWYKTDTSYPLSLVTVNSSGEKINANNIEITIYKLDWRWWWDSGKSNLARYVSGSYKTPVFKKTVNTINGVASVPIEIKYNNWDDNGRYIIHAKDPNSLHSSTLTVYFSKYGYWYEEEGQNASTILNFSTNKNKYQVGEEVEVNIPSSKNGNALVSIENGSKIIDCFWVKTQEKNTTFKFVVSEKMTPNIYINISLIQPHAQTENDAPIRLYGIIPISIEDPKTHLEPEIIMTDELEPEKIYNIKVKEKNGRKMTYTLAVVDEGLLALTNFETPNPWHSFFSKEALGVRTWDFYDNIIGAYGARLERSFAVGGDQSLNKANTQKVNRFKPVVSFIGPFELGSNDSKTHNLNMPNYIGAVKVMVVAGDNSAYGCAEKIVKVKKPLMILATLPRVLGPNEEVELPINVFVTDNSIKNVSISIETNDMLIPTNGTEQNVQFSSIGDKIAGFNLKVAPKIGNGKVSIIAKSGNFIAKQEIEITIRPSAPKITNIQETMLDANKTWNISVNAPGSVGTNSAKLELSTIPPIDLSKRLDQLINYPHGCIEQITSAVFPQLMLDKLMQLNSEQVSKTQLNIKTVINLYPNYQTSNGGFAYWQGGYNASDWGTSYAGHLMIKAEESGYTLPIGLKNKWLEYQQNQARNWSKSNNYDSELAQAYRLYTLALAKSPDFGSMNRLKEETEISTMALWRLSAAYAVAGQKEVAVKMINNLSKNIKPYQELSNTFGSDIRDKAMILETLILLNKQTDAFQILKELSSELSSDKWLSTQTIGFSLLAIAEYAGTGKLSEKSINASVSFNSKSTENIRSNMPIWQSNIELPDRKTAKIKISNNSEQQIYARIVSSGIPITGDTTSVQNNLKMEVYYTNMNQDKILPNNLKQGTDFIAVVSIKNTNMTSNYQEMALTSIFPSGWEIINNRVSDISSSIKSDDFTHQDIRDDRVLTYFNINAGETKTFRIILNATYKGKFYLPPVLCEAMYDNRINARKAGEWVNVVK